MYGSSRRTRGSGAALTLLVVALWLRLLVPAGWMPAEQGFGLRPCAPPPVAQTQHHASHDNHHSRATPEQGKDEHRLCPFIALAMALDAPPQPPLVADMAIGPNLLPALWPRKANLALALAAPPPPSTGPPHLI